MRIESAVVSIKCDADGCQVTQSGHGKTLAQVHNALRQEGWILGRVKKVGTGRHPDLCPRHAPQRGRIVLRA